MRGEFLSIHKQTILKMFEAGESQGEMARVFGVSQPTVSYYLKSLGFTGRNYNYFQEFTEHQRNVLLGTLLGDGHINFGVKKQKNPFLAWSHGPAQRDYLIWKAQQFGQLFKMQEPSSYVKDDGNLLLKMSSRCHPALVSYYDMFYCRPDNQVTEHVYKKMVTPAVLGQLTSEALAVWWADDGSVERYNGSLGRRDAVVMCLGAMTENEYQLVGEWFRGRGYTPSRRDDSSSRTNVATYRFSADDSERFAAEIIPYLPSCIWSKLGGLAPLVS